MNFKNNRKMEKNNLSYIYCFVFCVISLLTIFLSASMLPVLAPDSLGYIGFHPIRTAFYPTFLYVLSLIFDNLHFFIIVQVVLYILSFSFLVYTVQVRLNSHFITIFLGTSSSLNFYAHSFHSVILAESLTFSLINIFVGCVINIFFLNNNGTRKYYIITLSLISGLLFGLKPAMITFIPFVFIIFLFISDFRKRFITYSLYFLIPLIITITSESAIYKAYHENRESLAPKHLIGKAGILSTDPSFIIPETLNYDDTKLLRYIDNFFQPYQDWLETDPNPLVVRVLNSELEVTAQLYVLEILNSRYNLGQHSSEKLLRIGKEAILSNFVLYLSHGARNYIEFWQVKSLPFALKFQGATLPSFKDQSLQNVVKYLYKSSYSDNFSILFLFLSTCLGFCSNLLFLIVSFILLRNAVSKKAQSIDPKLIVIFVLLLIGLGNILAVSFANTPLTRYLMPHFSILILANLLGISYFLAFFRSRD